LKSTNVYKVFQLFKLEIVYFSLAVFQELR